MKCFHLIENCALCVFLCSFHFKGRMHRCTCFESIPFLNDRMKSYNLIYDKIWFLIKLEHCIHILLMSIANGEYGLNSILSPIVNWRRQVNVNRIHLWRNKEKKMKGKTCTQLPEIIEVYGKNRLANVHFSGWNSKYGLVFYYQFRRKT